MDSNIINIFNKMFFDFRDEIKKDFKDIEERLSGGVSTFSEHTTEIRHMKEDINKLDKKVDGVIKEQGAIRATLDDRIRDLEIKIATGKPNWFIVAIILALLSIIGGLWAFIIRGGF